MATAPQSYQTLERMVAAVEKVTLRLERSAKALEAAGIPYAVIGGNAIAAWVESVEPAAVRTTVDVDLLLRRDDFASTRTALEAAGFVYDNILGVDLFLDDLKSNPRQAVHILWANEKVRDQYPDASPDVDRYSVLGDKRILELESLIRMKLNSYRDKDRMHLRDLIDVGLIDPTWPSRYSPELKKRLQFLFDNPESSH